MKKYGSWVLWTLEERRNIAGLPQVFKMYNSSAKFSDFFTVDHSGVFRTWQRGGHGERAEREPITGVWGRSPQRGPGAEPLVGGLGGEAPPPEAKTFFGFECSMETANLPIFLKFGNAKDHQTLLTFAILAENGKKRTFSYKVACKKFSWSGQRGGIAPWPSP